MANRQAEAAVDPTYAANEDELVRLKIRTEKMEHTSRRLGILLKFPFVLAGLGLLIWIFAMIWGAWGGRGVIVDDFRVAGAVARTGLDGEAAAAIIRSHITDMQSSTGSSTQTDFQLVKRIEDDPIEIPQTGVTLGEVNRAVRGWLSDDIRVNGQLTVHADGFALDLKIGEQHDRVTADDVDTLLREAAERIFKSTSPYRYAVWLWSRGLTAESDSEFRRLSRSRVDKVQRAWALNGLAANFLDRGQCRDAIPILGHAARLGPTVPNIHGNLRNAYVCLGHEQQAADATARELRLLRHAADQLDSERIEELRLEDRDNLAGQFGDFRGQLAIYERMEERGDGDTSLKQALAFAELRDVQASNRLLGQWFATERWDRERLRAHRAAFWRIRFTQASVLENWPDAASFAGRVSELTRSSTSPFDRAQLRTVDQPLEAIALARSGQAKRAARIALELPRDCYLCARAQAVVAERLGLPRAADTFFRHAIALGPRLPLAYHEWGEAKLARGDAAGAADLFSRAIALGPQFAAAHKGRGDALRALGRDRVAVQAYQAAARRAPRWGSLRLAHAQALWRIGRRQEGRTQLCAATAMDLSRADRGRLSRLLAAARVQTC